MVTTKYRPELVEGGVPARGGFALVARALQTGVELGYIHTSDPEMTAYLFDAALAYNLHTHVTYGDPADMERLLAAAKEMFHKTLALPADTPVRKPAPQRAGPQAASAPVRRQRHGPGSRRGRAVR